MQNFRITYREKKVEKTINTNQKDEMAVRLWFRWRFQNCTLLNIEKI